MLNVVMTEDPSTCDPQKTTVYYAVPLNIFDRLIDCITVDGKPQLIPALAESWEISDDSLTYTFHLRHGVKFQNGADFTSDDVIYTIERMMTPANQTLNTQFYDMILGATDMYAGNADHVSGVNVIDDYTVSMTLAYPFGAFLANLAAPPCSMFDRETTEAAGLDFGIDPAKTVGCGPFKLKEWSLNNKLVLETYQDYWRGPASLSGVTYKNMPDEETQRMSFEQGDLDIFFASNAITQLEYFQKSDKWKDNIKSGREAGAYFYLMNCSMPPYDNVNVRKAIASAIDRELLLNTIYAGQGWITDGMVVEGVLGYNPDLKALPYDPEAAKQYLAAAGYPDGLKIQIMQEAGAGTELNMNVAIQAMLKEVGIDMEILQVDEATYYANRLDCTIPMERNAWWVDYNDPDNFLYSYFSRPLQAVNSVGFHDEFLFALLEDARREPDADKRISMYQEAEKYLLDNQVFIPIFQPSCVYILSDRVDQFTLSWNGWTDMSFYSVTLKPQA